MPVGLIALALGGFGIGLTEFGIVGLLPEVAGDFHVSESVAGYLVSGYALSVAVGALGLTALLSRFDRKKVLVALMVLFIVGNAVSALAPDYGVLMVGRVVAALCHGAFFSVGAVVAADMVAENKRGSAIALMFGGLTAANVLGVPLGTFLGQQAGWRATFWAVTAIGVITLIGVQLLVPSSTVATRVDLRRELAVFRRGQVWVSLALSVLAFGGVIGGYTYIAFMLTKVTGFGSGTVPWLLVLFGAGTFLGNYVGGRAADRSVDTTLISLMAALTVVLGVFALSAHSKAATVVMLPAMGAVGLAAAPGLQVRTMAHAGDAPSLASGANIAAFNVGNALGAWLGGLALAAGYGYVSPLWVGAALALTGLAVVVGGTVAGHRSATAPEAVADPAPTGRMEAGVQ